MPNTLERVQLLIIGILCVLCISFIFAGPKPLRKAYDCSLSEISPDFPIEVKQGCRKLRAENFQNSLQKPK